MAYVDQGMTGSKLTSLILAIGIVTALLLGLTVFMTIDAVKEQIKRVVTIDVEEEEEPPEPEETPPPPEPQEVTPPPPMAPPPPFDLAPPPDFETTNEIIEQEEDPIAIVPVAEETGTPPPPCNNKAAAPKGLSRWSRRISENYPARAIRQELQGNVGVSVTIGANGRVSGCSVANSSGHKVLDDAACKGMSRYARFDAALDCAAQPTTGSYRTTITYRLD